jgi:DNA-binding transcriptional LysR family regulator
MYAEAVSLDQIRYFVAVAEEQSITRAARRLHISQPPLTRQIRALEDELGAPLFRRGSRGVALLPSGERFLGHARRILDAVADAQAAVAGPEAESGGQPPDDGQGSEHGQAPLP